MNKKDLITIYTINHNYGKFLSKSIDSVLSQTYKNFELIIIDDGSKDNSKEILKKYQNNNKCKIFFQKNIGLVNSINKVLRIAKGKFIIRLDADDYFSKDAIKTLHSTMVKNKASIIFPDYYLIDESENIINRVKRHNFRTKVNLYNQPAHGACTMYKRNILLEVGGYSKEFDCQDGVDMWLKVINKYKIININKPLFYYRQHSQSLTKNIKKIFKTKQKIFEKANINKSLNNICIFPLRKLNELDYNSLNAIKILQLKIKQILKIKSIKKIILSTADKQIINFFKNNKKQQLKVIYRHEKFLYHGIRLSVLTRDIIKNNEKIFKNTKHIILYTVNDLKVENINFGINNIEIFNLNCVFPVKIIKNFLYTHNGKSLKPMINYKSGLIIERDIVYAQEPGIIIFKLDSFLKKKKIIHGKIGHIVI